MADDILTTIDSATFEVRDESRRELGLFIVPWHTVIDTDAGPEMFERGAFADVDPTKVRLRMDHQDPPTGKGVAIEERDDGAHMLFKVARTSRGDDQLALAVEGVSTGASVGFNVVPGGTVWQNVEGRRTRVHKRVELREVSTTWRPAYERAAVMYVRSKDEEDAQVADQNTAPAATEATPAPITVTQTVDIEPLTQAVASMGDTMGRSLQGFADRFEAIEERSRREIIIPGRDKPKLKEGARGEWVQAVLKMLSGERVTDRFLQERELDDLVTTDNLGVVPDAFSNEIIGVIDPRRPFLQSTRRIPTPDAGMSLVMPKIVTRPTVDVQANEKDELDSTATSITTDTFDAITLGGAGDISLQLLKRSSPSFLSLYLELLAEAYAVESEDHAVDALLGESLSNGGTLDPEDMALGAAWANAASATRRGPDTIWLSSAAVGAFINAKADGTNAPLYGDFRADFSAASGVGGNISGLRPVWVPALDDEVVDVIVGPSSGFAWAEDGTYTLQVDVPAKAGRDVAIVGILWFAPLYPAAFTKYTIAS